MRPIIDENGARLVDDDGKKIEGVRKFVVHYAINDVLLVTDVEFISTQGGRPFAGRGSK